MLNDRDMTILRVVVDTHVREGTPVSSQKVRETGDMLVSTATIRSSMARST